MTIRVMKAVNCLSRQNMCEKFGYFVQGFDFISIQNLLIFVKVTVWCPTLADVLRVQKAEAQTRTLLEGVEPSMYDLGAVRSTDGRLTVCPIKAVNGLSWQNMC
jgi:hypothetical protein